MTWFLLFRLGVFKKLCQRPGLTLGLFSQLDSFHFHKVHILRSSLSRVPDKKVVEEGSTQVVHVYIDGSCSRNGTSRARAGVGVYFGDDDKRNISERLSGRIQTNQRAELMAAIRAIEEAPPNVPLVIKSDSQYLLKGLSSWLMKWKDSDWKQSAGQPVVHRDLWERLDNLCKERDIKWVQCD